MFTPWGEADLRGVIDKAGRMTAGFQVRIDGLRINISLDLIVPPDGNTAAGTFVGNTMAGVTVMGGPIELVKE